MSKKKASPKTGTKAAAAKAPKGKKPTKSEAPTDPNACAKGGQHEWDEVEDDCVFCMKCHEAKPAKAKKGTKPAKTKKPPKLRTARDGKLSAIDAAAKVLGEAKEPMNANGMIEAMSTKGYWTSAGGKTPWVTLYSAILSEITKKGKESRFKKTERGHFALNA